MIDFKPDRPLLVFDGDCGFCRVWIDYWRQLTGDRIAYMPFQSAADRFPQIPRGNFESSVQLIMPDGTVIGAARAVFTSLRYTSNYQWLLWLYDHIPGCAPISERFYRLVAAHRDFFYRVTKFLWGIPLEVPTHHSVRWLFLRALALIYFFACASFGMQANGLIGSHGILPAGDFLQAIHGYLGSRSYSLVPTIFWQNSSDSFFQWICIVGVISSILLFFGIAKRLNLIWLYLLYLSIVSIGQDFMSFQWDMLLLEAGFLALFLNSSITIWLYRWLLFRLLFMSGAVKLLSGDPSWHNLTALNYHFLTQPLPTVIGYWAYQLPDWFHRIMALGTFFIELIVPFLIFFPRRIRFFAAMLIVFLQTLIFLTGNYTFFNLLTVAMCLFLLDDKALRGLRHLQMVERVKSLIVRVRSRFAVRLSFPSFLRRAASLIDRVAVIVVAIVVVLAGIGQLLGTFSNDMPPLIGSIVNAIEPYRIVNSYGLFAIMTTARREIVIEGSNDGQTWLEYGFKYKPGDLKRPPLWVQPFQPRLDWQMWFAALGTYQDNPWFQNLMIRLLQGSPEVLALLEYNPFPDAPPKFIRASIYDYHFADPTTLASTGQWWTRDRVGTYFPAASLP